MNNPLELYQQLLKEELFRDWKKQNSGIYLSHFFCQMSNKFEPKTSWEIGFFNPEDQKITVFKPLEKEGFEIKAADEVFKEEKTKVEELDMNVVKFNFEKALANVKEKVPEFFPKLVLGDGFCILQSFNQETLWNFTFIATTLQFVNLRLSAIDGEIVNKSLINVVQQEQGLKGK